MQGLLTKGGRAEVAGPTPPPLWDFSGVLTWVHQAIAIAIASDFAIARRNRKEFLQGEQEHG